MRRQPHQGGAPSKEFVSEGNLAEARAQPPPPRFRNATVEDFSKGSVQGTDTQRRFRILT
jgi:hypothetical protein